jgi:autotransporter translocation and assembly factor TamB
MKKAKSIRIIIILLFGAALILGVLYALFRAGTLNDKVREFAVDRLNEVLAGEVSIESLEGDLLDSFEIRGLKIFDPEGEVVVEVSRALLEWSPIKAGVAARELKIRLEGARVKAIKRGGQWNLSALRKPRPDTGRPADLPRLRVFLTVLNSELEISPSPDRVVRSRITMGEVEAKTGGPEVNFSISQIMGSVESPALGINDLRGGGAAVSTGRGWDIRLNSAELVTASSIVELDSGGYSTATSEIDARMRTIEIAPDTLALIWPSHPLAAPIKGSGSVGGDTDNINFETQIKSAAGEAEAEGVYLAEEGRLELSGTLKDFSLEKFFTQEVRLSGLDGAFNLTYSEKRAEEGEAPDQDEIPPVRRVKARLKLDRFSYPGIRSFPLTADVELDGDDYEGSILSENAGTNMVVYAEGGLAEPRPLNLRAQLYDLNPAKLREGLPDGRLSGQIELAGAGASLDSFSGDGHLSLDPTRIEELDVGRAELDYRISKGRITVENAQVTVEGAEVSGGGWIEPTDESRPYRFDLEVMLSDPEAIAAILGDELSVERIKASVDIKGRAENWSLVGSGEALGIKASYLEAASADFTAELSGKGGERLEGEVVLLGKTVTLPAARYGEFSIAPFDLWTFTKIAPSNPKSLRFSYKIKTAALDPEFGLQSEGSFEAGKNFDSWQLALDSMDAILIGQRWLLSGPATLNSRRGDIEAGALKLNSGEQDVVVMGRVFGKTLDMRVNLEKFDLKPWAERLFPGDTVSGLVNAGVSVKGKPDRPEIEGEVSLIEPKYATTELERASSSFKYRGEKVEFSLSADSREAGEIEAGGMAPVNVSLSPVGFELLMDEQMDVEIKADDISAGVIDIFIPWVRDADGRISLAAHVRGTPREPDWSGKAAVDDVSFTVPEWGLAVSRVNGEAKIVDNQVEVPALVVRSGEGKAVLKGGLELSGYSVSKMDLKLHANNFRAMNTPDIRATLDADLKMKGDLDYPRLSGSVKFEELMYRPPLLLAYQGMAWESEDPTVVVKGEEKPPPSSSAWLDRGDMNVAISIPDTGQLRNSELNVRFGGELTMRKPPGGFFLIFGKVESKEGWVIFQGKPFRVERGNFEFPAIPVIDPDLDILASHRVPDYVTYIRIGGSLSSPTLELYSEPSLDPADVLSVILFGKPSDQLVEGQRQTLASSGGQLVAGYAAAGLARSLSETLKLDTVILQAGETPETTGIGFGKYLNERLYLFYYHRFGEESAEEFKLRYEIIKNLSVEAGQDELGQGEVDLYYTQPY